MLVCNSLLIEAQESSIYQKGFRSNGGDGVHTNSLAFKNIDTRLGKKGQRTELPSWHGTCRSCKTISPVNSKAYNRSAEWFPKSTDGRQTWYKDTRDRLKMRFKLVSARTYRRKHGVKHFNPLIK